MANYRVVLAKSAERELLKLPESIQLRIEKEIDLLPSTPRPPGVKKLVGTKDLWRIRVGRYRIIYRIQDIHKLIDITQIRHRKDAYE